MKRTTFMTLGLGLLTLLPETSDACSTCFGDPNSAMTKGATTGAFFLLGIVITVEIAFGIFFFGYLRKRARLFPDGTTKTGLRLVKSDAAPHHLGHQA